MDDQEKLIFSEALIETCLEAVSEQCIIPLVMALGTLTEVICQDPEMADMVAKKFAKQAESIPGDVAGKAFLKVLGDIAARKVSEQTDLHNQLRLVWTNPKSLDTPDKT